MNKELAKTYNPKEIEEKLYEKWCENKIFSRGGRTAARNRLQR